MEARTAPGPRPNNCSRYHIFEHRLRRPRDWPDVLKVNGGCLARPVVPPCADQLSQEVAAIQVSRPDKGSRGREGEAANDVESPLVTLPEAFERLVQGSRSVRPEPPARAHDTLLPSVRNLRRMIDTASRRAEGGTVNPRGLLGHHGERYRRACPAPRRMLGGSCGILGTGPSRAAFAEGSPFSSAQKRQGLLSSETPRQASHSETGLAGLQHMRLTFAGVAAGVPPGLATQENARIGVHPPGRLRRLASLDARTSLPPASLDACGRRPDSRDARRLSRSLPGRLSRRPAVFVYSPPSY
jgi:hypothetical protein